MSIEMPHFKLVIDQNGKKVTYMKYLEPFEYNVFI